MPFTDIELNDGNKIPSIAYGSGSVNKGQDIHYFIEQAIEVGFSHLDTAQYYQNEESVGTAIRESGLSRSEFYVTSKWGYGNIQEALHASLTKIGLKQLDLYLIHTPTAIENGDYEGAWKTFEKIKEDGLAKSIGVSNFTVSDLQQLLKTANVKPAVNQIRFHPYNIAQTAPLLEFHAKHGIVTEAYGSLAPITTFPGGPVDAPLKKAAERLGISTTQVIFLWVKAKGAVIVTTSSSKQHLQEYLAVGDLPELTKEEIAAIDAAGAKGPPSSFLFVDPRAFWRTIWSRVAVVIFILALIYYYLSFSLGVKGYTF
ncbi:NADP-dependent oxidoreductase domain-containing protein [Flammula alnicola]|nr:NADP-dependent oxidoreductase domain-containing protein [Flammula alnicola]